MFAPYSRGACFKREHAARRLAYPAGEETARLRCDRTASQLRARVPCQSDIELLIRRRLPFHEPESPAAWMGCAVGVRSRGSLAAITRCRKGLGFGQTTVITTNICVCLCAVQGLLLLSSEVIKRGFEQGSQEQVGSLEQAHHAGCNVCSRHHAAPSMQNTSVRPITSPSAHPRKPMNHPHAQRCAATHADRRSSAFVPLCAGSAGSGGSGRRSRCLGFSACRGRPRSRSRKSARSCASNAMRYGADASRPEGLVPWSTVE